MFVKIDKSFVDDIGAKSKKNSLIGSIISLAHNMGLALIAEGVETSEQAEFLCKYKCDFLQGFYFFKPLTESQIDEIVGLEH